MTTRLSAVGVAVLVAAFGLGVTGVLAENPFIALWGQAMGAGLLLAWLHALRTSAAAATRLRLRFVGAHTDAGAVVAREPVSLQFALDGGLEPGLSLELELVASAAFVPRDNAVLADGSTEAGLVPLHYVVPASSEEHDGTSLWAGPVGPVFEVTARRIGLAAIHGLRVRRPIAGGLFLSEAFVAAAGRVTIVPRVARAGHSRAFLGSDIREAVVAASRRVRGLGVDVREIRDHVAGDPFKHIAWTATARRGKWMVKEFETDASLSVYLIADMGPRMRAGPVGERLIDAAFDTTFALASEVLRGGDRVGLVTVDRRIHGFVRGQRGAHALEPVLAELSAAIAPHRAGFATSDTDEVAIVVAGHLADHGYPDLLGGRAGHLAASSQTLPLDIDLLRVEERARLELERRGHEPALNLDLDAVLRAYASDVGAELPYRVAGASDDRGGGFAEAVERVIADRSASHVIVFVTQVTRAVTELEPAIRLAMAHRHRAVVLCPRLVVGSAVAGRAPPSGRPDGSVLRDHLEAAFQTRSELEVAAAMARLRGLGVKVAFFEPRR
ncbi:MAG: DUF58 domain-containing protein [Myxococcales bacterium]|nr:DUF58 domain-containing protein [Myxococcales bacterium]